MATLLTLDGAGILSAVAIGALVFVFGGTYGLFFLLDLILFLAMAALVTNIGKRKKRGIGVYERSRGWRNVLSNGLVPLAIAVIYFTNGTYGFVQPQYIVLAYVASVAAISADKFGSEIGVLDGEPVMLLTLKRVKKGISGGVTALGLGAGALASLVISLSLLPVMPASPLLVTIVFVSGIVGNIADSVFGYWEEKKIGNKYTSNLACGIAGAALCVALAAII